MNKRIDTFTYMGWLLLQQAPRNPFGFVGTLEYFDIKYYLQDSS